VWLTSAASGSRCPKCGAADQLRIVYGLPTGETFEASERGELVLGGCVVSADSAQWQCPICRETHGTLKR
jgi:rubrerythrin